jgi:hypothetical protein
MMSEPWRIEFARPATSRTLNSFPRSSRYVSVSPILFPSAHWIEAASPMAGISSAEAARVMEPTRAGPYLAQCWIGAGWKRTWQETRRVSPTTLIHSKQARLLRAIQVQATRVIAIFDPHRNERDAFQFFLIERERVAAFRAFKSFSTGKRAFADERETARTGASFPRIALGVQPKGADGHDEKYPAREQRDRGETAFAAPR